MRQSGMHHREYEVTAAAITQDVLFREISDVL